jgi:murein DD-endopeptidase MepM/ murein hydrolase activator NlpD
MATSKKIMQTWLRWKNRYRFQVVEEETYDVKFVFVLNRLNVLIAFSVGAVILMAITYMIIAITPLRQYIPGYGDVDMKRELVKLRIHTDKLENKLKAHEKYSLTLRDILAGNPPQGDTTRHRSMTNTDKAMADLDKRHKQDSIFRKQVEERDRFAVVENIDADPDKVSPVKDYFFTPLKGAVSKKSGKPLLISAGPGKPVMAALEGHVVAVSVELGKGQVITIQHANDYLTIYRGLENMSVKVGTFVKPGQLLAYTGREGRLEFELWYKGQPLDPTTYINFE